MRRLLASFGVVVLLVALLLPLVPSAPVSAAPPPGVIPGQYVVVLRQGVDPTTKANAMAIRHGLGLRHVYEAALTGFSATVPEGRLARLQADPDVLFISEDREVFVTEPAPTGVDRIQAPSNPAVQRGTAASARVAVLDTGIDPSHPDLNVGSGKACVTGDPTTSDVHGHGTHVAGTIGAKSNGSGVI